MEEPRMYEMGMAVIAFLAASGWAQTNWRINNKVNCDLCKEKEKRAVSKFKAVDAQFSAINTQMAAMNHENRDSHKELKEGVNKIADAHGALNLDTQMALKDLSGCIKALSKEIKGFKQVAA